MDERRLRRLFQFSEEDLTANRRGRFSANQAARLEAKARQEQKSAWESAAILFGIAVAGLAVGIIIGWIAPGAFSRFAMFVFMGALWPLVWGGRAAQLVLAAHALRHPQLSFVTGTVRVLPHGDGEFTLRVEDLEFAVDGNPSGVFANGKEYTIYYVAATREVLSVEEDA